MSQMEPEVKRFLKRIVWSLAAGLLWLLINLSIGIYAGLMVPEKKVGLGNIIFYVWAVASLALLLYLYYRIWREKFPHG